MLLYKTIFHKGNLRNHVNFQITASFNLQYKIIFKIEAIKWIDSTKANPNTFVKEWLSSQHIFKNDCY